jgi:hypothetical protein
MGKQKESMISIGNNDRRERTRKRAEVFANIGMLLICAGLVIPLFNLMDTEMLTVYKWVYSAGALIFLIARGVGASDPSGEKRLRRLRRLEFWAGVAFVLGASLWFYHEQRMVPYAGALYVIKDTILFSMVGAAVQIISSWLTYFATKKK